MGNSQSAHDAPAEVKEGRSEARHSHSPAAARKAQPRHAPHAPLPPSASSGSTTSTSAAHARATPPTATASPKPSPCTHTRARSITSAIAGTAKRASHDSTWSHTSDHSSAAANMGSAESKPQQGPPSRANTLPLAATSPPAKSSVATSPDKHISSPVSKPVAVPQSHDPSTTHDTFAPSACSASPYGLPLPNFSRPPRLPLPIEEEEFVPGSPILSPSDILSPIVADEVEGALPVLPRRASVTSSAQDEDDEPFGNDLSTEDKVPTRLEWNGDGEKIFVTGTFCQWERKMKLHRNKDGKPGFSAVLMLPPGTHHLKFLVDGEMTTTTEMPTTVDWTNILVNYIEVVAPLPATGEKQPPVPSEPMPIPGAAITAGQATATADGASKSVSGSTALRLPETAADLASRSPASRIDEKLSSLAAGPIDIPGQLKHDHDTHTTKPSGLTQPQGKKKRPRPKYTNEIPQFLLDYDLPKDDERGARASHVLDHLPQPPSLPMFLNKSILNGATPHKDDASVLLMPNHTVLNHLATSSIKQGVLATSGTTRYKRKFLTTIMYKPTNNDG